MALSGALSLLLHGWTAPGRIAAAAALLGLGGAAAFQPSLGLARRLSRRRGVEGRFAAAILCLGSATLAVSTVLYMVLFQVSIMLSDAEGLGFPSPMQLAFTMAAAAYQFAVLGTRLFFPLGFVALFAAAWLIARRLR